MRDSNASDRDRLLRPIPIGLFIFSLLLALVLVYPERGAIERIPVTGKGDPVAAEYLRLWVASHPEEEGLRLLLAKQLIANDRFDDAVHLLDFWQDIPESQSVEAAILLMRALGRQLDGKLYKEGEKERIVFRMRNALKKIPTDLQRPQLFARLARYAIMINEPVIAEAFLNRFMDLSDAADATLDTIHQLTFSMVDNGMTEEAFNLLVRIMPSAWRRPNIVSLAMHTASLSPNRNVAQSRLRLILDLIPYGAESNALKLDMALQYGLNEEAYQVAARIVESNPDDAPVRRALAQTARWTQRNAVALDQYRWLYTHTGEEEALRYVLDMGKWLAGWEAIVETLSAASQRRPLNRRELADLVAALENTGEPERFERALTAYIDRYPDDRDAYVKLAVVRERIGDLEASLDTWRMIGRRFGATTETVTTKAELLWRTHRPGEAFRTLRAAAGRLRSGEKYWRLYANLAWMFEEDAAALTAHRAMLAYTPKDARLFKRIIFLERERKAFHRALKTARRAWAVTGKPDFLIQAMYIAERVKAVDALTAIIGEASANESVFSLYEPYWTFKGRVLSRGGDNKEALASFKKALEINPYSRDARLGVLTLLVNTKQHRLLRMYLAKWRNDAIHDAAYWKLFATGYTQLGVSDESMRWRLLYADKNIDDYFWLVSLARDLETSGRQEEAIRLKRLVAHRIRLRIPAALADLSKPEHREIAKTYAFLAEQFISAERAGQVTDAILARSVKDDDLDNFAVTWRLGHDQYDMARDWLNQRRIPRERTPRWQRLVLALEGNDLTELATMYEAEKDISIFDKIETNRRLARFGKLLTDVREEFQRFPHAWHTDLVFHQTAGLHAEYAPKAAVSFEQETLGNLRVNSYTTDANLVIDDNHHTLSYSNRRLSSRSGRMELAGNDEENLLSWLYRRRGKRMTGEFELGVNARTDNNLYFGALSGVYRLRERLRLNMTLSVNEETEESPELRAVGAKDSVDALLFADLTRWDNAMIRLNLHRYHDREGGFIGEGYTVEAGVGTRIRRAYPEVTIRLNGFTSRNNLAAGLPDYAASILAMNTDIANVAPDELHSVGVSASARRGMPGLMTSPNGERSYLVELFYGYAWPDALPYYRVSGSIGGKVFGHDELNLEAYYANNLNGFTKQPYRGVKLKYIYRFGER